MMKKYKTINCNHCNEEVILTNGFTNTCICGTDYNGLGEELAPREQWGWETCENLVDMYNGNDDW